MYIMSGGEVETEPWWSLFCIDNIERLRYRSWEKLEPSKLQMGWDVSVYDMLLPIE